MKYLFKIVTLGLLLVAGQVMAATCTSNGNGDWKDSVWSGTGCNTSSGPPSGSTVVIANGTNIKVDSSTSAVASVTINAGGTLRGNSGDTLTLTGNFTNNGTFTANGGTVAFTGTNQTITGNVTFANLTLGAGTVLTLAGNVIVTGTLTGTVTLADTCPTNYTLTLANGTVMNSCNGGGGGGGSTCIPTTVNGVASPLIAGAGQLQLGTGGSVNGTSIVNSGNSSLPVSGTTSNSTAGGLPALTPASFPAVGTGTLNTNGTVTQGSYGTINASGNPTVFSGGTYYIDTLNATGPIQLAAGTYFINNLNLSANLTVSGIVQLFIGNKLDVKNNGVSLNAGGNAGNLQVNLYSNAEFDAGKDNVSFTGLVYSPFANSQVQFDNNATITGAVITAGQIDIKNNATFNYSTTVQGQIAGLACPAPAPVAEYRMDEASWNGAAGEVKDVSGNALHGAAKLSAVPAPAKICNGANLFNGSGATGQYIEVPDNSLLDIASTLTVTAWLKPNRWGGTAGKDALMSFMSKDTNYEAHVNATGHVFWWWGSGSFTSTGTVPVGAWTHVALVYRSGQQTIYLNGVASGAATVSGNLPVNTNPFQIGDDQLYGSGSRRFDGQIDEVKIFNTALSASQIATGYANENAGKNWDGSARVCPVTAPHHLEIQHASGTGLTCAASTVTVRACADATCATPYTGGVSGTLSATGTPTVNWDGSTGGASGAGFVIAAGSSSVTKNLQLASTGSVLLGITSPTPAPANATTCNFGTPSCTFTANSAGFIFSDTSSPGNTYVIPAQRSGVATPTLYLRAVQASTTNAAVCTPAIISSTASVNMGYTCNNPVACQAGNLTSINATAIAGSPAANPTQYSTPVSLTFDANGSAPITARYDDAGQITLNASSTVTPFGGATPVTLNGSSNAFVVAPHHFGFSGVSAGPIKAGNNFSATVTAYNGLATPTATPNFGKETAAEGVTLTFTKCLPTGTNSVNGTFSGNVGAFNSGAASANNLTWNEVGNGDLVATLTSGSYIGSSLTTIGSTGTSSAACTGTAGAGNVGRFIPDHFDTFVALLAALPMPCPTGLTCPVSYNGFVYSSQPFTTKVIAMNGLSTPTMTMNYDGTATTSPNFAQAVTLTTWNAVGGATSNPSAGTLSGAALAPTAFVSGTATLTNGVSYALPNPFPSTTPTAPTNIYIRAVDADSVTSLLTVPANSIEGGVMVVSGRTRIPNVYGSQLLALPLTVTLQYYNGSYWLTSLTDSVTSFDSHLSTAGGNLLATVVVGLGGGVTVSNPATSAVVAGVRTVTLAAPGVTGSANVSLNAPSYLPSAVGRATFGIYKSPLIYRRENY